MDGDDLIVGNILEKAYSIAKTQNIDVVQYFFIKIKEIIVMKLKKKFKKELYINPN